MYDNALWFSGIAEQKSDVLCRLNIADEPYVLATVHRQSNADSEWNMMTISVALERIAEKTKVVLPLHPRTRKEMDGDLLNRLTSNPRIVLTEPVSFLDMIQLEKHATLVMTDSGGVQKEAFFFGKPCVILREETEWVEIVEAGAAILADAAPDRIVAAAERLWNTTPVLCGDFGDGAAASTILKHIILHFGHRGDASKRPADGQRMASGA